MDDDPWISWKMAQTDDELHKSRQSHEKAERSDCDTNGKARKEKESAGPMNECLQTNFLIFFSFFVFLTAVGSGGVRARSNPAEFPLLRKVLRNSGMSEI